MRLVSQAELIALPEGTLYAPLEEPWVFGETRVKGEKAGQHDFYDRSLNWIDADNCGEATQRLDVMQDDSSASFPVEHAYGREGEYDPDARYLVHEADDVRLLLSELQNAYPDAFGAEVNR